jgi:excisionase family DNA binding protein
MTATRGLLTTREVGELRGLSPSTVLRRYRNGDLPGYRLSSNVLRFSQSEIHAWLRERRSRPGSATVLPLRSIEGEHGAR